MKPTQASGRLIPTQATGVVYEVEYRIPVFPETQQHGRGIRPTRWERFSLHSALGQRIPDGTYFLHVADGSVYQVKFTGRHWRILVPTE